MNAYKLNGVAGHLARRAIVEGLNVPFSQIYKEVLDDCGKIRYDIKELCDQLV